MKTKEIEGWVYLSDNRFINGRLPDNFKEMGESVAKAKLIIEIPEKKIEITESEFDEAWNKSGFNLDGAKDIIRAKLFGKNGEMG